MYGRKLSAAEKEGSNMGNNRDFDIFQLTWDDEHVPVLVPVVRPVPRGAVADGEARGLVRYQLKNEKEIVVMKKEI